MTFSNDLVDPADEVLLNERVRQDDGPDGDADHRHLDRVGGGGYHAGDVPAHVGGRVHRGHQRRDIRARQDTERGRACARATEGDSGSLNTVLNV